MTTLAFGGKGWDMCQRRGLSHLSFTPTHLCFVFCTAMAHRDSPQKVDANTSSPVELQQNRCYFKMSDQKIMKLFIIITSESNQTFLNYQCHTISGVTEFNLL